MKILTIRILQVFIIVTLPLVALHAEAHKIRVFAYETNGLVVAETKFSSGRPAQNVDIKVVDKNAEILMTGVTDKNGEYRFSIKQLPDTTSGNLTIHVDDGMGHTGTWQLEEAEYAGEETSHQNVLKSAPVDSAQNSEIAKLRGTVQLDPRTIEQIVSEAVAREIASLKQMAAEQQQKSITLQDILGGLGYILGLAGIAAYYKSKK